MQALEVWLQSARNLQLLEVLQKMTTRTVYTRLVWTNEDVAECSIPKKLAASFSFRARSGQQKLEGHVQILSHLK